MGRGLHEVMALGPQCPKLRSPHAPSTPRYETSRCLRCSQPAQEHKASERLRAHLIFSSDGRVVDVSMHTVLRNDTSKCDGCHNHDGHDGENETTCITIAFRLKNMFFYSARPSKLEDTGRLHQHIPRPVVASCKIGSLTLAVRCFPLSTT